MTAAMHAPLSVNQIDLHGRVAVVNGAAQGLGHAVAERLLNAGAEVALWDLDAARLFDAENALGPLGRVTASIVDPTMGPDVDAAAADAVKAHGTIDVLINCAGGASPAGPLLACRAIVPQMLTRGYGRIVNVAALAGDEDLIALTQSLAQELATTGILVNTVASAATTMPVGDAATMIAWLASEACSSSTGAVFDLSGGRGAPSCAEMVLGRAAPGGQHP